MTSYVAVLAAHSLVRWVVLGLLVALVIVGVRGRRGGSEWSRSDERIHLSLVIAADIQLVLGLFLYLHASPISAAFFADAKHAMKDATLRFFGVEHVTAMVLAVAAVHAGRALSRRAEERRHHRALVSAAIALFFVMVGIPWPFMKHGRPLAPRLTTSSTAVVSCPPVYTARCVACHGAGGRGDGIAAASLRPPARDFTDGAWHAKRTDAELAAVIRDGGASHGLSVAMPPNRDLSSADVDALVAWVRSLRK